MKNKNENSSIRTTMHCESKCGGIFFGGVLVIIGLSFILEHTGNLPPGITSAWKMWPALLVWKGLLNIFNIGAARSRGEKIFGLFMLFAGILTGMDSLNYLDLRWSLIWPALLIFAGIAVIFSGRKLKKRGYCSMKENQINNSTFETSVVMGGREDEILSKEFEKGYIHSTMGGLKLDMRNAQMKTDEAVLEVKFFMAGLELYIPHEWEVISNCSIVMGAIENNTKLCHHEHNDDFTQKRLFITGSITMGGIEIKN